MTTPADTIKEPTVADDAQRVAGLVEEGKATADALRIEVGPKYSPLQQRILREVADTVDRLATALAEAERDRTKVHNILKSAVPDYSASIRLALEILDD